MAWLAAAWLTLSADSLEWLVPVELAWHQPIVSAASHCGVRAATPVYVPAGDRAAWQLLSLWQQHPLAKYYGCFSVHHYALEQLHCEPQGTRQRAHCEWIGTTIPSESTPHIILVADMAWGIAHSSPQRITLPSHASVELFAHEIGHWLGLADEYAMPAELAQPFCEGQYQHPSLNIVVTSSLALSAEELQQLWQRLPWRDAVSSWQQLGVAQADGQWQLGSATEVIGLHAVATCAAVAGRYAWRPVAQMTPMQYHDIGVWPALYFELIAGSN